MKVIFKFKYLILLMCILIIIAIATMINNIHRWKIKKIPTPKLVENSTSVQVSWEEKAICEQFNSLEYNSNTYNSRNTKASIDMIDAKLTLETLTGYDSVNDIFYKKVGTIYSVKNYSQNCIIAIQFEDDADYYLYANLYYVPETLEQFINDLNLRKTLSFGSVWYEHKEKNYSSETIEFPGVSNDIIWEMLLNDSSTKLASKNTNTYNKIISISINIEELGYTNISINLTQDGYLSTNILDSRKDFYVGAEKVEEFENYIVKNCEGYKIVYVSTDI